MKTDRSIVAITGAGGGLGAAMATRLARQGARLALIDFRLDSRIKGDMEFNYLLADIREFNRNAAKKTVSLLESERREEMKRSETKKEQRKKERAIRLGEPLQTADSQTESDPAPGDSVHGAAEDDPDLLLNEAARALADMIELSNNQTTLAQELKNLSLGEETGKLN